MPDDAYDSVCEKVEAIFTELAGDRTRRLDGGTFPAGITSTIAAALSGPDASEEEILHADETAFQGVTVLVKRSSTTGAGEAPGL